MEPGLLGGEFQMVGVGGKETPPMESLMEIIPLIHFFLCKVLVRMEPSTDSMTKILCIVEIII